MGKYDEAVKYYKKALMIKPKDDSRLKNIGDALSKLGKYDEAIEYYKKALMIDPHFSQASFGMADALDALGRHNEAKECRKKVERWWKSLEGKEHPFGRTVAGDMLRGWFYKFRK